MSNRYLVIMAGGRGERFWPQSRLHRPKHLLPIVGEKPMLTQTVDRLEGLVPLDNIFVITNQEQREAVLKVVPNLPRENVVGEPIGRDTAAAVGLAATLVKERDPQAVFGILPADHIIHNQKSFQEILSYAFEVAEKESVLVTLGIKPTEPATGYGYIQRGEPHALANGKPLFAVKRFVEKPDRETAQAYLESGDYYWNAGMFVWRVSAIDEAFAKYTPDLKERFDELDAGLIAGKELSLLLEEVYPQVRKISIDYAVMEKADNVVTIEASFDWDDVGSWPAIERHYKSDTQGNVTRGDVVLEGSRGNIVVSGGKHLVAAIGVEDLIVIHTDDATLICRKDQAQEIKKIVTRLGDDPQWKHLI